MTAVLVSLANHLYQSTVFAVAVWALTLLFRDHRPQVRHALWLAASVKFLIPFSILLAAGSLLAWAPLRDTVPPQLPAIVANVGEPFTAPMIAQQPAQPVMQASPELLPALFILTWICGIAVSAAVWAGRWRRLRRIAARGRRLDLGAPIPVLSCAGRLEPGIFGIVRPILLLPDGIVDRLTRAQLQAVIAHEMSHVRRRDNLASALHMLVETLFWFYPLLWWMRARLVDEQERACDEDALGGGCEPQVYAESILSICKFYTASPLICVAGIGGADLKTRIKRIMEKRPARRLGYRGLGVIVFAAAFAITLPLAIGVVRAAPGPAPRELAAWVEPVSAQSLPPIPSLAANEAEARPAPAPRRPAGAAAKATDARISWHIQSDPKAGGAHVRGLWLTFRSGTGGTTNNLLPMDSSLGSLAAALIGAPRNGPIQFAISREAGVFRCDGVLETGSGNGTCVFSIDAGFRRQMTALGFSGLDDDEIVSMAVINVGPPFAGEMRAAGVTVSDVSKLMAMRALGVTGDYARSIQDAGFAPDENDLVALMALGVSTDLPREIRQMDASVSMKGLTGLVALGVTSDFIRGMQDVFPSIRMKDLMTMRALDITPEFAREARQENPSTSVRDVIARKIFRR